MLFRKKLKTIWMTSQMCGLWHTIRFVLIHLLTRVMHLFTPDRLKEGIAFDKKYGVETCTAIKSELLNIQGENAAHAVEYAPTPVKAFQFMIKSINIIFEDYIFVDLGAG